MARLFRFRAVLVVCTVAVLLTGCSKREEPSASQSAESSAAPAPTTAPAPTSTAAPGSGLQAPALAQGATAPGGSTPAPSNQPPTQADFDQMAAQNAEALKAMNQGKDIEPISLDTLKGFLPATLAGMKRGETDARQMGMMGIKMATVHADYEDSSGSDMLELMIMDLGNASGPARMGITGWARDQVDQQTDTGYEKSVTYQGYKGMEEYDRQDQHGEFHLFVGDRFVVEVTGDNVTMEIIKQAMGQVDLKKLAKAAN